jgi:HTH-type transcriptional regulator/antitoxin HigA
MEYKINSDEEYRQVMEKIEAYLVKSTAQGGAHTLSAEEKTTLRNLSLLAETWEDGIPLMPIKQPQTLVEMLALKMYEKKLNQKELATLLDISATRLSEIMHGKRQINMDMAKRLYQKLDISPTFILEKA